MVPFHAGVVFRQARGRADGRGGKPGGVLSARALSNPSRTLLRAERVRGHAHERRGEGFDQGAPRGGESGEAHLPSAAQLVQRRCARDELAFVENKRILGTVPKSPPQAARALSAGCLCRLWQSLQVAFDISIRYTGIVVEVRSAIEDGSFDNLAECLLRARQKFRIYKMPELLVDAFRRVLHLV